MQIHLESTFISCYLKIKWKSSMNTWFLAQTHNRTLAGDAWGRRSSFVTGDIFSCTWTQHPAFPHLSQIIMWCAKTAQRTPLVQDKGSFRSRGLTYCILRVEDVGGRWVVYDDDFTELSAQPAEVFDVVSSVENTGFPEEPGTKHPPLVQQVCHRVSILNKPKKTPIRLTQSVWSDVTATAVLVMQRVNKPWLSSPWRGRIQRAPPSSGGTRPRGASSARTPETKTQKQTHL